MTTTLSARPSVPAAEHLEWWERQQIRRQRREVRYFRLAGLTIAPRAVLSWLALTFVLVVCVVDDDVRSGVNVFVGAALIFPIWFMIARSKTISWRVNVGCFIAAVIWAALVAVAAPLTSDHISEVGLLLIPFAVVAIAVPGRARRFAVNDWLLIGAALGAGYQAAEWSARAVTHQLGAGTAPLGATTGDRSLVFALTGVATGLGVELLRYASRLTGRRCLAGRVVAAAGSLVILAIVVGAYLPKQVSLPLLLRVFRATGSSSAVLIGLLIVLILAGFLIDAHQLRATDEPGTDRLQYPYPPADTADRWTLAITGPGSAGPPSPLFYTLTSWVWAACCMVTYVARDLLVVLGAHIRDPKEPAAQARSRGRAAATLTRVLRAEAFRPLDRPDDNGRQIVRGAGISAAALLLVTGILLGGLGEYAPVQWLHIAEAGMGEGTRHLGLGGTVAAATALAALLLLSGGAPGTPIGESGSRRLMLDHGRGAVAFARPGTLTQRLQTSTVAELLLDALTAAVTLIPAAIVEPITGSATSGPARAVMAEFCADPGRLIIRRRKQLSSAPDDTGAMLAVRTGTWDAASRRRWVDSRVSTRAYRITSADGRTSVPADGLCLAADGAAMLEATHLHRQGASMLYEGGAPAALAQRLLAPFDDEMRRYATVIRDPHNPVSRLRLVVGSDPAAGLLGDRAREILGPDLDMMIVIDPVEG